MSAVDSVFSRIVSGALPCYKVFETTHALAFLDINSLATGHTLVIPKRAVETLDQLSADECAELGRAVHEAARRMLKATGASAYNVLQNNGRDAGQEVPYVHFHIIPRTAGDKLGYRWAPQKRSSEELAELAAKMQIA